MHSDVSERVYAVGPSSLALDFLSEEATLTRALLSSTLLCQAEYEELHRLFAGVSTLSFCLANPHQPDCPITFASETFLELTGYRLCDLLGHNCRLLQGQGTDRRVTDALRSAVTAGQSVTVRLLNYRKSGEPFLNQVHRQSSLPQNCVNALESFAPPA